jgi:hypothetical protein
VIIGLKPVTETVPYNCFGLVVLDNIVKQVKGG